MKRKQSQKRPRHWKKNPEKAEKQILKKSRTHCQLLRWPWQRYNPVEQQLENHASFVFAEDRVDSQEIRCDKWMSNLWHCNSQRMCDIFGSNEIMKPCCSLACKMVNNPKLRSPNTFPRLTSAADAFHSALRLCFAPCHL